MCELFGGSGKKRVDYTQMLQEFFSHAKDNPHGWGIFFFTEEGAPFFKKEPVSAEKSAYLKRMLSSRVEAGLLLAHIRLSTKGGVEYKNTHPFDGRDRSGREWILEHNGTVFESEILSRYIYAQEGETDSERILYYLVDRMNQEIEKKKRPLSDEERAKILEDILFLITPENKINLLIYDGELLYVHTNYKKSLHICKQEGSVFFSTKPLGKEKWEELPLNRLLVFREDSLIYEGIKHENEFFDDPEKMRFLYLDFAEM